MAASLAQSLFVIAAAASLLIGMATAADYTVGAPAGSWDLRTNLSAWASAISFKTGDELKFVYDKSQHDVLEVSKSNYDTCGTTGPIKTYNSGNDVIPLSSPPGDRYFICGVPTHCTSGMKVQIHTTAASTTDSPPPENGIPGGPTPPSPSAAGRRCLEGKMAAAGLVGVGVMMLLAL